MLSIPSLQNKLKHKETITKATKSFEKPSKAILTEI
jgi:hypothetical protein